MLTRLELKNFRVFGKADFELKPLTILVGENGTGKSTILYALCFIAQSLDRVNYRDSIDLRSFDETVRKGADSFEIGMEVEEDGRRIVIQEEFEEDGIKSVNISTDGKALLKTEKEWIVKEIFKKRKSYSVEKAKEIEEIIDKEGIRFDGMGVLRFDMIVGGSILVRATESSKVEGLVEDIVDLHKDLTNAINIFNSSFHRIVPILADRSIFEDSFTVGGHKPEIKEAVKNSTALGNILTWLKRAEEYEKIKELNDAFKQLDCRLLEKPEEEALGQGVIFMEDLSLKTATRGSLTSYGYSKVAQLIAPLVLSPEGSTLCIEDPEIHLHPGAQAVLMDLIIKSMKRGDRQAIITTHSEASTCSFDS
ncbi:MAG: AAA family ATPase [Candidatus Methanospirareceae archaeon]